MDNKKIDNSKFQLVSIYLHKSSVNGFSANGTITAYRDNTQIGTPLSINFDGVQIITGTADFDNIDEFRIEAADINFFVDDLTYFKNNTWSGSANNDWADVSNWSKGEIPDASNNTIIPSSLTNYATATTAVDVNTLTINSGASFIAESSVSGVATYSRNIPDANWYLVSVPVGGETFENVISNHTFKSNSNSRISIGRYLNDSGPPWFYATTGTSGLFSSGLGVSMKLVTPADLSVTGTINTSSVLFPISMGTRTNFNLIGNPFTAFVNSATFAAANTPLFTEVTIWLWNGTSYSTYNTGSSIVIAPRQEFLIEASSNGDVTFATTNQNHHQTDTL